MSENQIEEPLNPYATETMDETPTTPAFVPPQYPAPDVFTPPINTDSNNFVVEDVIPNPYSDASHAPTQNYTQPLINNSSIETQQTNLPLYDIYSLIIPDIQPNEWHGIPNDPHKFVRYWSSPEALSQYNDTCSENNTFQDIFYSIGFLINLFINFILFCCSAGNTTYFQKYISPNVAIVFVVVLLSISAFIALHYFLPNIYAKWGIVITLSYMVLISIISMCFGGFFSIGVLFALLPAACIAFLGTYKKHDFIERIAAVINSRIINFRNLIMYAIAIAFVSIWTVFFIYTWLGGILGWWNRFFVFYIIVSYWNIITVIGNVLYMYSAITMADSYFQATNKKWYLRLLHTFGTAVYASLVYPWSDVIRDTARSDSAILFEFPQLPLLSSFVKSVGKLVREMSLFLAKTIDEYLTYPTRRALIYVAIYGIDIKSAQLRYAEEASKKHADAIADDNGESLVMFICLTLAAAAGTMCKACGAGGGYAFFLAFGLAHVVRSFRRGSVETLFACFAELPRGADNVASGLTNELSEHYNTVANRRGHALNSTALLEKGN